MQVAAPATEVERALKPNLKVKLRFNFGENSDEAVRADWADHAKRGSWTAQPTVWRHPLTGFSLWINGEEQGVPYEALAGQGDVSQCQVWSDKHRVHIQLDGGDAGLAYSLELEFRESKRIKGQWILARRVWRVGEFPDEVWDETTYHNSIWDDPDM